MTNDVLNDFGEDISNASTPFDRFETHIFYRVSVPLAFWVLRMPG